MKQPIIIKTQEKQVEIAKYDEEDYAIRGVKPPSQIVAISTPYNDSDYEVLDDEQWDNMAWYVVENGDGSVKYVGFDILHVELPTDPDKYSARISERLGWSYADVHHIFQQAVNF